MRRGVRLSLLVFTAVCALSLPAATSADINPGEVVADAGSSGFVVETLDGVVTGSITSGIGQDFGPFNVAADGTVVHASGNLGPVWLDPPLGPAVELDANHRDFDASISPDGTEVAFARLEGTLGSSDLFVVGSDGSGLHRVASGGSSRYLWAPTFSPDGGSIAYGCRPADFEAPTSRCGPLTDGSFRTSGVMRMNADGSGKRMIVIGPGHATEGPDALSWSPNGQWLAMDGDAGSNQQVFVYKTDGSDLFDNLDPTRQVTHETDSSGGWLPQFCGGGRQILYLKTIDDQGKQGNFSYLIDRDGTGRREIHLSSQGHPWGKCIPPANGDAPPPLVDATHVKVPGVGKLTLQAAQKRLEASHLRVGTVTHRYSSRVPANHVISQDPKADARAHRTTKAGPKVQLVLSRGEQTERLTVRRAGKGSGKVTSQPAGISCGATCEHDFANATRVVLTATAARGSTFSGWAGACSGKRACVVRMTKAQSVKATFAKEVFCVVPKLEGKPLNAAKRALAASHCSVGRITRAFSPKVKKDYVISQSPAAGRKLQRGAKVALTVSKGKKKK